MVRATVMEDVITTIITVTTNNVIMIIGLKTPHINILDCVEAVNQLFISQKNVEWI